MQLSAALYHPSCVSYFAGRVVFSPLPAKIKNRTSIYADDLLIFLSPNVQDFINIRRILDLFAGASGLITNVDKCLGAPLSLSRINRGEEQHLVDAIAARIPTWKAGLLTNAGRATLTQTTLSAILVHVSICCCLSAWAIDEIDRQRRAFLSTGSDTVMGGRCKVAWPILCAPKDHGGLGIPDLRILGYAPATPVGVAAED
jgi:hypothetical protein